jgi:hypothetical protein
VSPLKRNSPRRSGLRRPPRPRRRPAGVKSDRRPASEGIERAACCRRPALPSPHESQALPRTRTASRQSCARRLLMVKIQRTSPGCLVCDRHGEARSDEAIHGKAGAGPSRQGLNSPPPDRFAALAMTAFVLAGHHGTASISWNLSRRPTRGDGLAKKAKGPAGGRASTLPWEMTDYFAVCALAISVS